MSTTTANGSIDLVIARYQEKLDWLNSYNKYNFDNIFVYNKGKNNGVCALKEKQCIQETLKNEGRCDHTYLYHIIKNYDTLANVTIFTKGSSYGERERKKLDFTVKMVFETNDTVFSVSDHYVPVNIALSNFSLDSYRTSHPENYTGIGDTEGMSMKPAEPRPFGVWYEKYFPGITTTKGVYAGVFAVSKAIVHQHPKSYYQSFITQLEGHPNPEVGHYFERAWIALFNPVPENYLYLDIIHENGLTIQPVVVPPPQTPLPPLPALTQFGGRRKKTKKHRKRLKRRSYKR